MQRQPHYDFLVRPVVTHLSELLLYISKIYRLAEINVVLIDYRFIQMDMAVIESRQQASSSQVDYLLIASGISFISAPISKLCYLFAISSYPAVILSRKIDYITIYKYQVVTSYIFLYDNYIILKSYSTKKHEKL